MAVPKARSNRAMRNAPDTTQKPRGHAGARGVRIHVDTDTGTSVSFAPPEPNATITDQPRPVRRPPVAVGPGRPMDPSPRVPVSPIDVNDFPIQTSKIQCPPLREQTLSRGRLLDWLEAKIHHRLVFVTAEAGYGKTTLLADFSRRTRMRTLWYRLDETDRDWVTVLNHLVAAGRVVDPEFASATWSLLGELGTGGAPMSTIVATYIRELQGLGERGAALILDDYHVVEDEPDIQYIVREIVAHASDRLTIVIASRRQPILPVARLRTLGEVSELDSDDLRFEPGETEQLFRETYGRPLEADVLGEINRRTNGWVASLQLVQSALRERTMAETRLFVQTLSGARGNLHDYLAEEVVGDLEPALQAFLMRTSILSALTLEIASFAAGIATDEARRLLDEAARIGLLPRSEIASAARYHPLVRDFLEDRLRREVGEVGVADLHRAVARHGETHDWKLAAHHFAAAGDLDDVHRVLVASLQDIMGTGGFALAESYVRRYPEFESDPAFGLFLSRRDLYAGLFERAVSRAQAASDAFPTVTGSHLSHLALANLASVNFLLHRISSAMALAAELESLDPEESLRIIAAGTIAMGAASIDADLEEVSSLLGDALLVQMRRGHDHYAGITHLNMAENAWQRGVAHEALSHSDASLTLLSSSSAGTELPSLNVRRAWALLHSGDTVAGRQALDSALASTGPARISALIESATVELWYGSAERTWMLVEETAGAEKGPDNPDMRLMVRSELLSRAGEHASALSDLLQLDPREPRPDVAFAGRWHLQMARIAVRRGDSPDPALLTAEALLARQKAGYWLKVASVVRAIADYPTNELNRALRSVIDSEPVYASVCADDLALRLGDLDATVLGTIEEQSELRPERWLGVYRRILRDGPQAAMPVAATMLDRIGEIEDISRLRAFVRTYRGTGHSSMVGRGLARRLAPIATVFDLGHLRMRIGDREVDGSSVRRKVLSLVAFLLTRPGFTATRDQVLEALWPELEPSVATNSLNQTIYFLRRVFEEKYREDESAQYLHHDGEVIRLDSELVHSQSSSCAELIDRARVGLDPGTIERLSRAYTGRFAIDFEYDDWASPFRETLHAGYLDVIEQAIRADTRSGHFDRASLLARRALAIDPEADSVEVALLRIYSNAGSHSAAAEQYSHYAALGAEDGLDVPPLRDLV
jgi:ATP/maltotriose-dependent transcriptional regulator MalT/DNA-binding SARP family transcriptional activator